MLSIVEASAAQALLDLATRQLPRDARVHGASVLWAEGASLKPLQYRKGQRTRSSRRPDDSGFLPPIWPINAALSRSIMASSVATRAIGSKRLMKSGVRKTAACQNFGPTTDGGARNGYKLISL